MNTIQLRHFQSIDLPFIKDMLYEAVFWRKSDNTPAFDEAMEYPEIIKALKDWGERDGDTAVIATINSIPVGAAWYRYWEDKNIRGYINENIPVLAIGVHRDHRHKGIGKKMMEWLINYAFNHSIDKISLAVSKDNHAINLYRQKGFREYEDKGDWFIMVRDM